MGPRKSPAPAVVQLYAILNCHESSAVAPSLGPTSFTLELLQLLFLMSLCRHSILSSVFEIICDLCVFVFLPSSFDFVLLSFT